MSIESIAVEIVELVWGAIVRRALDDDTRAQVLDEVMRKLREEQRLKLRRSAQEMLDDRRAGR
jgi:hypothetical protein